MKPFLWALYLILKHRVIWARLDTISYASRFIRQE